MASAPFGTYIKERRHELKLSLKEAARRTGIQASRLHDLEQGKSSSTGKATGPTRENVRLIARGYQVPEELLTEFAGYPRLEAGTAEEKRLLGYFRGLVPGHRETALLLVEQLYRLDQRSDQPSLAAEGPGTYADA